MMVKKTSLLEDPIFQTLVAAIAAMVARLANLKSAGRYQEAADEIDHRLEELVGLKIDQLRHLGDGFVIDLLTVNGFLDVERLWYVAELIHASGEIKNAQGRTADGMELQTRAVGFFLEVAFNASEEIPQVAQRIDNLSTRLVGALSEDTLFSLYDYYEQRGEYAKAEKAINRMVAVTRNNPDILSERRDFYRRLLGKSDDELELGGLTRSHVESAASQV